MGDGPAVLDACGQLPDGDPGFAGKILCIGFGGIARGLLPLLFKHFRLRAAQLEIISADDQGREIAARYGSKFTRAFVCRENYQNLLEQVVRAGDVVLNLAVEVSSIDVLRWCQAQGVIYLDTGIEPWQGGYAVADVLQTTNYWLREQVLALRGSGRPTAVVAHGANPGLVNHLLKQALRNLAESRGFACDSLNPDWGRLAQALDVRSIHIAERDTQTDGSPLLPGEFACTWSVDGLLAEAEQPAELGWGTHESALLPGMRQPVSGGAASVYWPHGRRLPKVKSWVPSVGEQEAWLITHNESISIADFLTVRDESGICYRPTVCYAYHPCPKTWQSLENWENSSFAEPVIKTLISPAAVCQGQDELGVLLCFPGGAYWYGSTLDIEEARRLAPHNNATTLQVAAGMLGGLTWALRHPRQGVVEADQMDFLPILGVASPYLGRLSGCFTDWQPQHGGSLQFAEFIGTELDNGQKSREKNNSKANNSKAASYA